MSAELRLQTRAYQCQIAPEQHEARQAITKGSWYADKAIIQNARNKFLIRILQEFWSKNDKAKPTRGCSALRSQKLQSKEEARLNSECSRQEQEPEKMDQVPVRAKTSAGQNSSEESENRTQFDSDDDECSIQMIDQADSMPDEYGPTPPSLVPDIRLDSKYAEAWNSGKHVQKKPEHVAKLINNFNQQPVWDYRMKVELAKELSMTYNQVIKWNWDYRKKVGMLKKHKASTKSARH